MPSRVAVVVLTMDNYQDTRECLDSVLKSKCSETDVVLVDNHSTDGSIERLRVEFPGIHHLRNATNLGVAGGRNAGWNYVRERLDVDALLFLDNDTVIETHTICSLMRYLEKTPEAGILCAKAYTAPPSRTIMSAGMYVNLYTGFIGDTGSGQHDTGQFDDARVVPACGGFCFLVRRSVFEECGGLDNDYNPYGWEDVDLCLRARRVGHECHYVPEAIVYHKGCKIGRGYVPLYEKYKTRHYFLFLRRHTNGLQKVCLSLILSSRGVLALLRLLWRGEHRIVAAQLSGAVDLLFNPGRRAE